MLLAPSPKSQNRLVIVPVEASEKVTSSGHAPLVGLAVKFATGATAPLPVTEFVLLPSFAVVNRTTLLKLAALVGAKRTTTLVALNPPRLNGVPDRIVNGPPEIDAVPLVRGELPRLVTTKAAKTV